jgi:hypothetical protein
MSTMMPESRYAVKNAPEADELNPVAGGSMTYEPTQPDGGKPDQVCIP